MRLPLLPSVSDVAILAGALWESPAARTVRAVIAIAPAVAVIMALALATGLEDRLRARG